MNARIIELTTKVEIDSKSAALMVLDTMDEAFIPGETLKPKQLVRLHF